MIARIAEEGRPVDRLLVIAHSFGTAVAVDALAAVEPRQGLPAVELVTLGSPLEFLACRDPTIQTLVEHCVQSPAVLSWTDYYDRNDRLCSRAPLDDGWLGKFAAHPVRLGGSTLETATIEAKHAAYWGLPQVLDPLIGTPPRAGTEIPQPGKASRAIPGSPPAASSRAARRRPDRAADRLPAPAPDRAASPRPRRSAPCRPALPDSVSISLCRGLTSSTGAARHHGAAGAAQQALHLQIRARARRPPAPPRCRSAARWRARRTRRRPAPPSSPPAAARCPAASASLPSSSPAWVTLRSFLPSKLSSRSGQNASIGSDSSSTSMPLARKPSSCGEVFSASALSPARY